MKYQILMLLAFFVSTESSRAQSILVRKDTADKAAYLLYLSENPGMISYVDSVRLEITHDSLVEKSLFQLADHMNQSPLEILGQIEEIAAKAPLTPTALEFLKDLFRRLQTTSKTQAEKNSLRESSCKIEILVQGFAADPCPTTKIAAGEIIQHFPFAEAVFLESQEIKSHDNIHIVANQNYNWTLASNVYRPERFYGTFAAFLEQNFSPSPLITGHCHSYDTHVDLPLTTRALAFFSKDCVRSSDESSHSSGRSAWISENQKWLIPAGLLLAGGIALSLRDKTLVFDIPF